MRWILFLGSLALGAVLSALAIGLDCRACDRGSWIAWAGLAGYVALVGVALRRGPNRLLFAGVFFAFGVHSLLVVRMAQDRWCWICAVAAANSVLLAVLAILLDRANLKLAGFALPWSAVILLVVPRSATPQVHVTEAREGVRLVVLERAGCDYCRELRDRVLPRLEGEFGDRVEIRFRSADDVPGVVRTPTLILTKRSQARVIDGLPPYEMLRDAVARALEDGP